MTKKKKTKLFKIIVICLAVLVALSVLLLLYRWTLTIDSRNKNLELVSAIEDLVSQKGELGLFQMANISVDSIYKDGNGYSVIQSEGNDVSYSGFELQNMNVYEKCADSVVHVKIGRASCRERV